MAKLEVTLKTLGSLDGGHAEAIVNHALAQIISDADDRGDDGKPRKAIITVTAKKAESGFIVLHVEATTAMPKQSTGGTMAKITMGANGKPRAVFEELAPDNPDQGTLGFEDTDRHQA